MMLPESPLQFHIICQSKIWYASAKHNSRNIDTLAFRVLDRHSMHKTNANPLERTAHHHLRIPLPRPRKPPPRPLPPMALAAASPCALSDYIH